MLGSRRNQDLSRAGWVLVGFGILFGNSFVAISNAFLVVAVAVWELYKKQQGPLSIRLVLEDSSSQQARHNAIVS